MKKWECTVCGYIHEGDEPPETCPLCGAGAEYFKEITAAEEPGQTEPVKEQPENTPAVDAQPQTTGMRKWECTVCGYIHEGDEPPKQCPVCGVGPEYFREIVEKEIETLTGAALAPEDAKPAPRPSFLRAQVMKHHLHPIAVHTPNGVLPAALVFLVLAMVFGSSGFEMAAFFNLVLVLLAMPFVIVTGVIAWQERYKGAMTRIFGVKIGATIVVCSTLLALVVWRLVDPSVASSPGRWTYLVICLVSVAGAGLAGHMGGKLVFGARK
ncbi:MAG: rubredoxin-type Fe(Cys)4 protein [Desulfofustis sp.]|jgi:rubredoxin/uncharacterized membrane protein|nr:rubredoxin-type Fe(Cys)4 protein [Desulfofustis sp.]